MSQDEKTDPHPPLTVAVLRKLLEPYRDDVIIQTEGCDCWGVAGGVKDLGNGNILITRNEVQ